MKNGSLLSRYLASATAAPETTHVVLARSIDIEVEAGATVAPTWVQIFPAGPDLATVDGRKFRLSDPQALADRHNAAGVPILVDYDHLSAFDVGEGGDQTAAGWIDQLEVRDGEVWAKVAWTVRAADAILAREWRFVSPEFSARKDNGEVVALDALALVNRPAFTMRALAGRKAQPLTTGDVSMKAIAAALGLPEDATEAQILAAIQTGVTELASAKASKGVPSSTDYMPRADYDRVLARAETAEAEVEDGVSAKRAGEVDAMIEGAVKAGKIAPASKEHWVNLAKASDTGFEEVKAICSVLPALAPGSGLGAKVEGSGGSLSDDDKAFCRSMGLAEADFIKERAARAA